MSVANRFRQSITKALSLTDIDDDSNSDTKAQSPKVTTSESIIAKSVNLFSKFTHNNNNSNGRVNSNKSERRQKTLLVVDSNRENEW